MNGKKPARLRSFICLFLSLCLLVQGCLKKDSKGGSRKGGPAPEAGTTPHVKVRGGLAITLPKRGFVDKPITWVQGTAPAGSRIVLMDGPSVIGEGTSTAEGVFSIGVSALGEGAHLLRADATGVGSSTVVKVTVDTVAPAVSFFVEIPPAVVSEPYARFRWQGSEDPALFSYKLDDQSASPFALADRIGMNALTPGTHTFIVVAKDLAGNQGQPASVTFAYQPPSHEKLTNLIIAPNPFTPNGDGVEDTVTISASMADGAAHAWKIEIKNTGGTLSKSFGGNGTTISTTWDGKSESGVPQAVATYSADITVEEITRSFKVHLAGWKTGYLNQSVEEITLPAPGMDIGLNRRYRSDRASESGAFGKGMFSDVLDTKITVDNSKLPVTFKTPSEQKMTFPFKREFAGATGFYKATWAAPEGHHFRDPFAPSGGVYDENNDPKNPSYINFDTNEPYNPGKFVWTQRDKEEMSFSVGTGIDYMKDPNKNQWTFSSNSITHSNGRKLDLTRDEQGRITEITDPNGNATKFAYDAAGHLISKTDAAGYTRTMGYDANHRLLFEKSGTGTVLAQYAYDAAGNPVTARDSLSQAYQLTQGPDRERLINRTGAPLERVLNSDGTLARLLSPSGQETTYSYNDLKLPIKVEHPLGYVETLTYDSKYGDAIEQVDKYGNTSTFTYNSMGQVVTSFMEGHSWSYTYDETTGNLLKKNHTLPEGVSDSAEYTYNSRGQVITERDPTGKITSYEYDMTGNRIKTAFPDGANVEYAHDANGNIILEKSFDNNKNVVGSVSYSYDALNRLSKIGTSEVTIELSRDEFGNITQTKQMFFSGTSKTESFNYTARKDLTMWTDVSGIKHQYSSDGNGQILVESLQGKPGRYYRYDVNGNLVLVVDAEEGGFERWGYDALNRVVERESSEIPLSRFTYDAKGRMATEMVNGVTKTFTYNAAGKLASMTTSDGMGSWTSTYDAKGRITSSTDATGLNTSYSYDAKGHLTEVVQKGPGGEIYKTFYTHDEKGNRLTQTDAKGRVTKWTYDAAGRVTSRTLPMGQTESFFYNESGQRVKHQKFDGNWIEYAYTPAGKLYKKIYPDGSTVNWVYDSDGRLVEILDYRGSTKQVYGEDGRLAAVVDPKNHVLNYDYEPSGKVTRTGLSGGETRYGFDEAGRLVWIRDLAGKVTRYTYENVPASMNRTRIDHGNGTAETFEYDAAGRLIRLRHLDSTWKVLKDFQYARDAAGRVTKVVEENGRTVEYVYDSRGMLTKEKVTAANGAVEEIGYGCDEVGNRLKKTRATPLGSVVTNYTYNANDELEREETSGQEIVYRYDPNGNTLSRKGGNQSADYRYDCEDHLSAAEAVTDGQLTKLGYAYDPEGIRTSKFVMGPTGQLQIDYVVDKNRTHSQVVAEYRGSLLWSMGTAADMGERGNEVISSTIGSSRYQYHYDGQNRSVRMVTEGSQNPLMTRDYDAFGNLAISASAESGMGGGASSNLGNWMEYPYGFAGEEFDPHLGMSYNRARYYDPRIGRFSTRDTWQGDVHDPLSLHQYIYTNNDPVNRIDPSGQWSLAEVLTTQTMMKVLKTIAFGLVTDFVLWTAHQAALVAHGVAIVLDSYLDPEWDLLSHATEKLVGITGFFAPHSVGDLLWGIVGGAIIGKLARIPLIRAVMEKIPAMVRGLYGRYGSLVFNKISGLAASGVRAVIRAAHKAVLRSRVIRAPGIEITSIENRAFALLDPAARELLEKSEQDILAFLGTKQGKNVFVNELLPAIKVPDMEGTLAASLGKMKGSKYRSVRRLGSLIERMLNGDVKNIVGLEVIFYDADRLPASLREKFHYALDSMSGFKTISSDHERTFICVNVKGVSESDLPGMCAMFIAHEGEHVIDHLIDGIYGSEIGWRWGDDVMKPFLQTLRNYRFEPLGTEIHAFTTQLAFMRELKIRITDIDTLYKCLREGYPQVADILIELHKTFLQLAEHIDDVSGVELPSDLIYSTYGHYDKLREELLGAIDYVFRSN